MTDRTVLFGGTFDPVHNAHLTVARAALLRFGLVGALATGVQYLILVLLVRWAGAWPPAASVVGFLASAVGNYLLNYYFTFRSRRRHGPAAMKFLILAGVGLVLNLSEQRTADAKLRLLARRAVQSQEDERGRLARELCDGTSQTLVSAKLLIESAFENVEGMAWPAPGASNALGKALQRLDDSLVDVHRISRRLRPALLDTLGLPAALERLVDECDGDGHLSSSFAVEGQPLELTEEAKTALFRVAQEALTNVQKHAQASCVRMRLGFSEDAVRLDIEDDGCGFVPDLSFRAPRPASPAARTEHPRVVPGLGLRGMQERAQAAGGQLDIESTPGSGSTLYLTLPAQARRSS